MIGPAIQEVQLAGVAAATSFVLPARALILAVVVQNQTANAVSGGLKFGTTSGGTDVIAAQPLGANALTHVPDASIAKRIFSDTASQTLYLDAVTAWNSAIANITVLFVQP